MTQQLHGTLSGQSLIRGALSGESNLTGTLSAKVFHLTGTLSGQSSIRGALSGASQISGSLSVPLGSGGQPYWGRIKGNLADQLDLAQALDAKSDVGHNHNNLYSLISHNHDQRYSRLNHDHDGVYSPVGHNHNSLYSPLSHDHDGVYSPVGHNHNSLYSPLNHDHDDAYAAKTHNHDNLYALLGHTHDYSDIYAAKNHDHNDLYALLNHTHDDLYSPLNHNHDDLYALLNHTHDYSDIYAAKNHDHDDLYSQLAHRHDDLYALLDHDHDDTYAAIDHNHNSLYSLLNHNHDSSYSAIGHTHDDRYYTESEIDTKLNGKANSSHTHDDRYYTESEVDTKLSEKANSSHAHGNITSAGAITSDTAAANGDKLVLADSSNSSKLIRSGISFDGSTTSKALTPKGTWESFAAASHNHDDRYFTETESDNRYVNVTGDTMTGSLSIIASGDRSFTMKRTDLGLGDTVDDYKAFSWFFTVDKNARAVCYIESIYGPSKESRIRIANQNLVNGSLVANYLDIGVWANGSAFVSVNNPAAWRSAMGAMNDVKLKSLNATMAANASSVNITASPDSGYTFVCWVGFTPSGFAGVFHCTSFSTAATTLWQDYGTTTSNRTVACFFLEKK